MRLQDMQQSAVPRSYWQLHDALRQYPAIAGLRECNRASQNTAKLRQTGVPSVGKGDASRGKVAVRQPAQYSDKRQRTELGKLSARLVKCQNRAYRQDRLVSAARQLEADRFARSTRISNQVFERFRDRRRRGRKIEEDAGVSQVHPRRDVQPK